MTDEVVFALIPIDALRAHEEVVPSKVRALEAVLRRSGVFDNPIWVARGSDVILNGHHRVAALRHLGAQRIPAWVVDYDSTIVSVDRWTPGPAISKTEVVRRAAEGKLFSPRTTRHRFSVELPRRPTPLAELLIYDKKAAPRPQTRGSGRPARARSSPPG